MYLKQPVQSTVQCYILVHCTMYSTVQYSIVTWKNMLFGSFSWATTKVSGHQIARKKVSWASWVFYYSFHDLWFTTYLMV